MRKNIRYFAGAIILLLFANTALAQNSVLSTGNWYKITVDNTGIHRITYDDLLSYGMDPSSINPKHFRLYGNGNGMLPEDNDAFRYDDLEENSIYVFGEEDETFDTGDYILFYGEGPTEWNLNEVTGFFEHEVNLYSDYTFYFITTDLGEGKRIETQFSTIIPPTYTSTSYNDYVFHEMELENLIHSGKKWYGERFEETIEYNYSYTFPNLITNQPVILTTQVAARSTETSNFNFEINEETILSTSVSPTNISNINVDYAKTRWDTVNYSVNGTTLNLKITYDKPNDSAIAWLDYFTINTKRNNIFESGQMHFRDIAAAELGIASKFEIIAPNGNFEIWNITDPLNPSSIDYTYSEGTANFILETDSLLEFIAFDESQYFSPEFDSEVLNQNLHGVEPTDLIIVTHEDFLAEAHQLADFRETNDGYSTFVTTPEKIYNEFSSGAQDMTAIRDFAKYIFYKSNGDKPENLLLFGDASYDYKNINDSYSNFISTWESPESLNPVGSYCTDDFYSEFDENDKTKMLQIGIGRLPAKTTQEANAIVQKIMYYSSNIDGYGSWRNEICFIADDEDNNLHFNDSEKLALLVDTADQKFNISKTYLDSYEQETTPNGQFYPNVNQAITDKINEGVLYINYIGHGNYNSLAHEMILTEEDLENWDNPNYYPFMLTATCDFGRFDDPDKYSMAEKAILMESKGMSAILSATRATYAGGNLIIQKRFLTNVLYHPEYSLGKLLRLSKQESGLSENTKKYYLFGDPSMRLAIPAYKVITEIVNGTLATNPLDTINPGDQIIVSGYIVDTSGEPFYNFNGSLEIKVYDRIDTVTTLGNDPQSNIAEFLVRDSILLILDTEILNGHFSFAFQLPYELDEDYGNIKLSYYGMDYPLDARGQFSELVVGGPPSKVPKNIASEAILQLFPTLCSTEINYKANHNITNLQLNIFDLAGRNLATYSENNIHTGFKNKIDVSQLQAGMYIMRINADKKISIVKIIKQ